MAGNSVPAFFGSKGRTFKPVSLDVTFASDTSGSMSTYVSVLSRISTIQGLESSLRGQGVGIQQDNRYSVCTGAGGIDPPLGAHNTLAGIEVFVGSTSLTRWATGTDIRAGSVVWPLLTATAGNDTEDMALAAHLIAGGSRDYEAAAERILISAGDLRCPYLEAVIDNSVAAATLSDPATAQRYVGIHPAAITITEPASANPVPPGFVFGYVFTTASEGVAIYNNNGVLSYRQAVDNTKVAIASTTFASSTPGLYAPLPGQADEIIAFAALTQGAIYDLGPIRTEADTLLFAQSLGDVLGSYLYEASS